jgi:hypothetical protein
MSNTERIEAVRLQLEKENPGFGEYLASFPAVPAVIDLDEIVEMTDLNDPRSVARAYFLFAYNEFGQRKAGAVSPAVIGLMVQLFEDAMVGDPAERITRHRALLIGDSIEMATGPTGASAGWYEAWGASIDRLHEFERKLRAKFQESNPTRGVSAP